jgi:hypothetical protein
MEEIDIKFLIKNNYWISCKPINLNKWDISIYKCKTTGWIKIKNKTFIHPIDAYSWALNYLKNKIKAL